jgi:hypothetical protein
VTAISCATWRTWFAREKMLGRQHLFPGEFEQEEVKMDEATKPNAVVAARLRLHQAHSARIEANRALEVTRSASARAQAFAIKARDRCVSVEEENRDVALDRAIAVKSAILSGSEPTFEPLPALSANVVVLRELENCALAAELAEKDFAAAEDEALRAATAADDELRAAAQSVALAIAHEMAVEIEEHEGKALRLRALLGSSMSPVGQFPQMTDALRRVIVSTDNLGETFARRGDLWNASKRAASVWREHLDGLMADPDARLDFDPPAEEAKAAA